MNPILHAEARSHARGRATREQTPCLIWEWNDLAFVRTVAEGPPDVRPLIPRYPRSPGPALIDRIEPKGEA